jgi:glucose-1-phosphate thymidylyltransferase
VGPNVTIEAGAVVRDSTVREAIVSTGARVIGSTIEASLIGDDARIEGQRLTGMVAAKDEVAPAP